MGEQNGQEVLIQGVEQELPAVIQVETIDGIEYQMPNGVIVVKNEITLGDIVVSVSIMLLLVAVVSKWFITTIWRTNS